MVEAGRYGLLPPINVGSCSWRKFIREVFRLAGVEVETVHIARARTRRAARCATPEASQGAGKRSEVASV